MEPAGPGPADPGLGRDDHPFADRRVRQDLYDTAAADRVIAERVATIAAERGVPRARVALAWVLRNPVVTAPIVGASKAGHLDDAAAAVELSLTDDEVARLEQPYTPHDIAGFG